MPRTRTTLLKRIKDLADGLLAHLSVCSRCMSVMESLREGNLDARIVRAALGDLTTTGHIHARMNGASPCTVTYTAGSILGSGPCQMRAATAWASWRIT